MVKKISAALVIATYNWPEALRLVLESVLRQSVLPEQIIIADDGSTYSTKRVIDEFKKKFSVPLKHFWQEDNGFQKTIILNKSIAGTDCEYIIQVDGDIVLHKHFISDHLKAAEKGFYIRGSRVLILEKKSHRELATKKLQNVYPFSSGIKNRINALRMPVLSNFFVKKTKRCHNVSGCNCAFWKTDFVKVNGYNNDIKGWGHEDIELAARFINSGLLQKKIKMTAICYHLYHSLADRNYAIINFKMYEQTVAQGIKSCGKGYNISVKKYLNRLVH